MRSFIHAVSVFVLAVSCSHPSDALAQQTYSRGIHLLKDEYGSIVAVDVVYGTELTAQDMAFFATLKNVVEISLGGNIGDEFVTIEGNLMPLAKMESLESVFLCKRDMEDEDLEFVAALPRIEYLEFMAEPNPWDEDRPVMTDRSADYLSRASTLRDLCIYGGKFTDDFVSMISQHLHQLEHLEMDSGELTDDALRMLATHCTELKWLDIQSDRFTDDGVKHLARAKKLEMLWLRSTQLTANSVKFVSGLDRLRHLELTVPTINNNGTRVLANLPQLEILALRKPPLTDKQFSMFKNHPALTSAFINGSELSIANVIEVIDTIPNLNHLSVGRGNRALQDAVDRAIKTRQQARDDHEHQN